MSTSTSTSTSASPDPNSPSPNTTTSQTTPKTKNPLALPEAPSTSTKTKTTTLDLTNGSTSVSLDHLGPIVVNVDGTMSRISNWDKMAEIERKNTVRIIGKRNKERLGVLRAKEKEREDAGTKS